MKKSESKDCLLCLFLSIVFCLFVGYGFISLGGCEMDLSGKIFATIVFVGFIALIWCCKDCCKEKKDSTNQVQIKNSDFSFTVECDGKTYKIKIKDFQIVPKE